MLNTGADTNILASNIQPLFVSPIVVASPEAGMSTSAYHLNATVYSFSEIIVDQ